MNNFFLFNFVRKNQAKPENQAKPPKNKTSQAKYMYQAKPKNQAKKPSRAQNQAKPIQVKPPTFFPQKFAGLPRSA